MSDENSPEEIPDVIPVTGPAPACPHCGGQDITRGLTVGLSNEVGQVGMKYDATGRFLGMALLGTEPLRVDLCNGCGTVTCLYVANPNHPWS